jgi:RHS repeat-associated protein
VFREETGGLVVESSYDIMMRRIERRSAQRALSYTYDTRGRLAQISEGGRSLLRVEYNLLDQAIRLESIGFTEHREHDAMGRILRQRIVRQGDHPPIERRYEWSAGGDLVALADSLRGTKHYHYDGNGRVIAEESADGARKSWTYDALGNITSSPRGSHRYDARGRLTELGARRYSYDERGQLVELLEDGRATRFGYDLAGRLVRVEHPEHGVTAFGYDVLGRRLFKRRGGVETRYLWDVNNLIAEVTGDEVVEYFFVEAHLIPLGRFVNGELQAYVNSHAGVPQELFSERGELLWAGDHDLWGNVDVLVERAANPLRFLGQLHDAETGLAYNRHRYYDAHAGRYITPDPYGLAGGINAYSYVANPLLEFDPFGLDTYDFGENYKGDPRDPVRIETETVTNRSGETFERPVRASGVVQPTPTGDRGRAPRPLSGYDTTNTAYERGHLFALGLGGPEVRANIVPQGHSINMQGNYRGNSRVPASFDVSVRVGNTTYRNPPPAGRRTNRGAIRNACR